ncbi:MAG TPA: hypothetical protein VJ850_05310 [Candidatus Limnocylindrales bacterium]|nr:hypothetical protein [Candidatus Limnocylindrales bacterium]
MIGPAPILAVIVGLFHVSAYVFIRGRAGARLPLLIVAAILGAWAGDTAGSRISIDPLRIGDFHLLLASFVAWLGIGLVAILSVLVPERSKDDRTPRIDTQVVRAPAAAPGAASAAETTHEPEQGVTT